MIDFTNIMKNKTDYLTFDEIETMLNYCYSNNRIRDYMLIRILFRTGRRVSEIVGDKPYTRKVGLRPCDIHPEGLIEFDILKKHHIKSKTKSGNERNPEQVYKERLQKMPKRALKPIDEDTLNLLKDYIAYEKIRDTERIFPITRQRVCHILKSVSKACNIKRKNGYVHPHQFRHSLPIFLLKSNPNDAAVLRQVQEILDHSDIRMTMEYAKFTQYDKQDMLNKSFGE